MAQYISHTLPLLKAPKPKKNHNTIILFGDNDHTVIANLKKRLCFVRVPHCSFRTCSFVSALARPHKILIGQKAANWPQYPTSMPNTKQVIPTLKSKRGSGATTQLAQNSRSTIFIWVFTVLGTYNFSKRLWQLFAIHALPSQFSQCEFVWHVRLPMHGRF